MAIRALRVSAVCLPLAVLLGAGSLGVRCHTARAQNANALRGIVANNAPSGGDLTTLDKYFLQDKGFFANFKQPKGGDDLPKLRRDYNNMVRGIPDAAGHRHLNLLVLKELRGIMGGSYPRVVKVNAMLMIADLNDSDQNRNIKPSPQAFAFLMLALGSPPDWDYIKPAALIGLTRFAQENGIPQEKKAEVTEKLLALVNEQDPPPGRSASAHNFMRRGAAGALAAMQSTGPDNRVVKAFETIAADPKAPRNLRCEMARFIGELSYPPEAKVDLPRLANILGHQAVEICRQELDRKEGKDPQVARRVFMYALDSCNEGLQKLSSESKGDTFIFDLRKKVDGLYRKLEDTEKTSDADVAALVETEIGEIATILLEKPKLEPLAPAAPKQVPATPASTN